MQYLQGEERKVITHRPLITHEPIYYLKLFEQRNPDCLPAFDHITQRQIDCTHKVILNDLLL